MRSKAGMPSVRPVGRPGKPRHRTRRTYSFGARADEAAGLGFERRQVVDGSGPGKIIVVLQLTPFLPLGRLAPDFGMWNPSVPPGGA